MAGIYFLTSCKFYVGQCNSIPFPQRPGEISYYRICFWKLTGYSLNNKSVHSKYVPGHRHRSLTENKCLSMSVLEIFKTNPFNKLMKINC